LDSYVGLRLITPTSADNGTVGASGAVTFSGVASVSLNGVFSSTYDNYKIILDVVSSGSTALNTRLRVSGADNSTSNYNVQYAGFSNTTTTAGRIATGTSWNINGGQNVSRCFYEFTMTNPFATQLTQSFINMSLDYNGTGIVTGLQSLGFAATTSFTGLTFYPSSGTITGTVRVYGYKN
jgi:hypothetical protein